MAAASTLETRGYNKATEVEGVLNFVASEIASAWRDLARELNISQNCIENIDEENSTNKEKAIKTVYTWYRSFGQSKTCKNVLYDALEASGYKLIADKVRKYDVQESKGPHEKEEMSDKKIPSIVDTSITTEDVSNKLRDCIESMCQEESAMLEDIRVGLSTASAGHMLRNLQHLRKMSEIIDEMIKIFEPTDQDATTFDWAREKREHRISKEHIDQYIKLIQEALLSPVKGTKSAGKCQCRPKSEIPMCSSGFQHEVVPRSLTEGAIPRISDISSPICCSKTHVECSERNQNIDISSRSQFQSVESNELDTDKKNGHKA